MEEQLLLLLLVALLLAVRIWLLKEIQLIVHLLKITVIVVPEEAIMKPIYIIRLIHVLRVFMRVHESFLTVTLVKTEQGNATNREARHRRYAWGQAVSLQGVQSRTNACAAMKPSRRGCAANTEYLVINKNLYS